MLKTACDRLFWEKIGRAESPDMVGRCMHADVDEQAKKEIKEVLVKYDRTLLVADPRRCEPKKCAPSP